MSGIAEISLLFGGEERLFRMTIGPSRKVQAACDAGPMELLQRYATGTWRVDDVRAPIREGLIAGGMAVNDADKLLRDNFDDLPKGQFVLTAQLIISASVIGDGDDEPGEMEAGETSPTSLAEKSDTAASTETVQP